MSDVKRIVCVQGADRAGKSTQCARLIEYLERSGHTAELWKFPDRTAGVTGVTINESLTNKIQKSDKEARFRGNKTPAQT